MLKKHSYSTKLFLYLFFVFFITSVSACGNATPIPPTQTPLPPTATLSPPTPIVDQTELLEKLTTAIQDENAEGVEQAIAAGVEINVVQPFMQLTPLAFAAYKGNTEIVVLLLENGADVNLYNENQYGTTALIEAAQRGQPEVVKLLLDHGADINQQDKYGDPALNWATYYGHLDVVQLLVDRGCELTVVGSGGGTALKTAIARGHAEIEQLLRDAGATE